MHNSLNILYISKRRYEFPEELDFSFTADKVVVEMLRTLDHNVTFYESFKKIKDINIRGYDVMIVHPDMGYYEITNLQRIYPYIPLIITTGEDIDGEVNIPFKDCNGIFILQKPFTIDLLNDTLEKIIKNKTYIKTA